jgi:dUTP pyrophosphatase
MKLIIKKLSPTSITPTYGTVDAAGLDLYADSNYIIKSGSRQCVSTGIALEWSSNTDSNADSNTNPDSNPENYYLRIAPRSGLAYKNGIDVGAGVIDYGYRGEIKIILFNHGDTDFVVASGDRVAQAILTRIIRFDEIIESDVLTNTSRGSGGFGSTGTR